MASPVLPARPRTLWVVLAGLVVFAVAFALRFEWVLRVNNPFDNIYSDMWGYVDRALRLAGDRPEVFPRELAVYPFGTHTVYGAEAKLLGWDHRTSILVAHCAWGAIVAPCTMLLALRIVPRLWVALPVGLLMAVWQPHLVFSGFFSQEQISSALFILNAWLLTRHLETGRGAIVAGLTAALAYVVKPQFILTVFLLAAAWWLVRRRWKPRRVKRILAIVGVAVGIAAVRYFSITSQLGLICDEDAFHRLFADTDIGIVESTEGGRSWIFAPPSKLQTGENRKFSFQGFIGDRPPYEQKRREEVRATALGWRIEHYLSNVSLLVVRNELWPEMDKIQTPPWRKRYSEAWKVVLYALLPFSALGMLSLLWKRRVVVVIATAHVVTSVFAATFFYGEMRYRIPYDAFLVLLGLAGVTSLVSAARWLVGRILRKARPAAKPASA